MRRLNVAVAGCGPCGLAAALLLGRQGHDVSLFERFETPKPIGSGLMMQPTGMAVLAELGLSGLVMSEGARIDRLFGTAGDRVVLDVHYRALGRPKQFGIGIHRSTLFNGLYDAVNAAGIRVRTGVTIDGSRLEGDRRKLRFADGSESDEYDLVVDALGARSALAEPCGRDLDYGALWSTLDWPEGAGFDRNALQQRYRRSSVMVGVLPIGVGRSAAAKAAFFWSLRCDRLDGWRSNGLDRWKDEVLSLWPQTAPLLDQIENQEQLTFARYSHRTLKHPVERALIHIGDAWHSASPQLGQGANMALLDAWSLSSALERAETLDQALDHAISMRRMHVLLYQWLTALFTPVYQSDSRILPILRDGIVGPLSRLWPATWIQAAMVGGLIGSPLSRLGLNRAA